MHVTVIGGTGLIGSRVVNRLRDHGATVRVATSKTGVDAYTGAGLADALTGAQVVVDALNLNRPGYEYDEAKDFFVTCTRNILEAETAAGVGHHVGLSMFGAGTLKSGYFRGKAAQEWQVASSTVPHSMLRTTILYELVEKMVDHVATTHMVRLPPVRIQPVSAEDVAAELTRIAIGPPLEGFFEFAGPEKHYLDELARRLLAARGDRRPVVADPAALYFGAHIDSAEDALVPQWEIAPTAYDAWLGRSVA